MVVAVMAAAVVVSTSMVSMVSERREDSIRSVPPEDRTRGFLDVIEPDTHLLRERCFDTEFAQQAMEYHSSLKQTDSPDKVLNVF